MEADYRIGGILLKTRPEYADVFLGNWRLKKKPQAFCIFDKLPVLPRGKPVFTHVSGRKHIGFVGSLLRSEFVPAYKPFESDETRLLWRERIWQQYHDHQLHTHTKSEFDKFWEMENGVRSLVLVNDLVVPNVRISWRSVQRIMYTGYPVGVGYRYLLEEECRALNELCFGPTDFDEAPPEATPKTCYAASIAIIPQVLRKGPMTTKHIYEAVAKAVPQLCDDTIRCVHKGKDYHRPEWKHQVRSAQQALKNAGTIERDPATRTWRLR